jgi:hypothetical protein
MICFIRSPYPISVIGQAREHDHKKRCLKGLLFFEKPIEHVMREGVLIVHRIAEPMKVCRKVGTFIDIQNGNFQFGHDGELLLVQVFHARVAHVAKVMNSSTMGRLPTRWLIGNLQVLMCERGWLRNKRVKECAAFLFRNV